jgi:DNA-cytosine methyltransferase
MAKKTLYGMTLFSGMGGSALGMESAGIKDVFFNDFLVPQVETLKLNYMKKGMTDANFHCGDVTKVTGEMVLEATGLKPGEMFMLQASPPCQDFSGLNTGKYTDAKKWFSERNSLYKAAFKIAEVVKPEVIVYENVPEVTNNDEIFFAILDELKDMGYRYESYVLQSGYYDSAQNRPRLWIVAYRGDKGIKPTEPPRTCKRPKYVKEVLPNVDYVYYPQFSGFIDEADRKPMKTITKTPNFYVDGKTGRGKKQFKDIDVYETADKYKKRNLQSLEMDIDKLADDLDSLFEDTENLSSKFSNWLDDRHGLTWIPPTVDQLLTLSDFPLTYKFPKTVKIPLDKPTKAGNTYRTKEISKLVKWGMIGNIVLPKQMEEISRHIIKELGY